ncbi:MAG: radical SAM protein [Planctomycetes bacterium]|nr:radical SAM protein [Planctomycetota bacterium]
MKKVVFIEPRAGTGLGYAHFLKRWPLLGCLTMATMLHRRGHDVKVYSENLTGSVLDDDRAFSDLLTADFVGLTALTPSVGRAYEIAARLEGAGMKGRLVMGGAHASLMPDEALAHVPCVVQGEGETVITALVEDNHAPQGIVKAPRVANLDDLPTPDLCLMHRYRDLWKTTIWKEDYQVPIATSRGCPYGCKYCTVTKMYGRRYRMRSVDEVFEDIMYYHNRGYRSFFFYDDNFAADRARTAELLERIAPLDIRWSAQCRIDFPWTDTATRSKIDHRLMAAIAASGVDVIYVGYETLDESTAKHWNKGYQGAAPLVKRMEQDTRILHDHGVWVHGMFVMGPQHDATTFARAVDFSRRNKINTIQMSILTPYPGTEIMEELRDDLIFNRFPDDWKYFDGTHVIFHHRKAGNEAMQTAVLEYHRKYYQGMAHQWDRLRRMARGPGGIGKKIIKGVRSAWRVRKLMKAWEAENRAFIEETQRRGAHYLHPAERTHADSAV